MEEKAPKRIRLEISAASARGESNQGSKGFWKREARIATRSFSNIILCPNTLAPSQLDCSMK